MAANGCHSLGIYTAVLLSFSVKMTVPPVARLVRVYDTATGGVRRCWHAHGGAVTALALCAPAEEGGPPTAAVRQWWRLTRFQIAPKRDARPRPAAGGLGLDYGEYPDLACHPRAAGAAGASRQLSAQTVLITPAQRGRAGAGGGWPARLQPVRGRGDGQDQEQAGRGLPRELTRRFESSPTFV